MLRLILYSLCVSLVWTLPFTGSPSKFVNLKNVGGRIIDGDEAALGQFPWQVAIYFAGPNNSGWFCGGGIISEEWILTAGHCVVQAESAEVYPGLISIDDPVEVVIASTFILHEKYNGTTIENDIGLAKLRTPLRFGDTIQPITLASDPLEAGTEITVSGWGITSDDAHTVSNSLNYITLTVIENQQCQEVYVDDTVFDDVVCASPAENSKKSPCSGDSGGPVIINPDTDPLHVAVVSFVSDQGCETGSPAGFTRTAYYRDWIKTNSGV